MSKDSLSAAKYMLSMVGQEDFHLIHDTVRNLVAKGEMTKEEEADYAAEVDRIIDEEEDDSNN